MGSSEWSLSKKRCMGIRKCDDMESLGGFPYFFKPCSQVLGRVCSLLDKWMLEHDFRAGSHVWVFDQTNAMQC